MEGDLRKTLSVASSGLGDRDRHDSAINNPLPRIDSEMSNSGSVSLSSMYNGSASASIHGGAMGGIGLGGKSDRDKERERDRDRDGAAVLGGDLTDMLHEPLCPPEYFGIVEPGVYRSNLPNPISFPFIKLLKLKTVLLLSADVPTKLVKTFFEENAMTVHHLGLIRSTMRGDVESWKPISEEMVKDALEMVLDAGNHPVMLCDATGMHQIGAVVGCLRRLQHWCLNAAVNEYRSFAATKIRYQFEQYIELFDVDLITLPKQLPSWFQKYLLMEEREKQELSMFLEKKKLNKDFSRIVGKDDDEDETAPGLSRGSSTSIAANMLKIISTRSSQGLEEILSTSVVEPLPRYLIYYYCDSAPLSSEEVIPKPRIQTLPNASNGIPKDGGQGSSRVSLPTPVITSSNIGAANIIRTDYPSRYAVEGKLGDD